MKITEILKDKRILLWGYGLEGKSMKITEILKDKRILLWGYGLEGKSTEKFIRTCCDVRELTVFQGKRDEIDEDAYDYIIKSPGIVAENLSGKFTSMTELFLTEFSGQVIGITGTKGKSTTSSLMYTVLSKCTDRPTLLVGNIGLPALDYYTSWPIPKYRPISRSS